MLYEDDYRVNNTIEIGQFDVVESSLTSLTKKLRHHPFSDHLLNCLNSYTNALDQYDAEFRFMKLWTTLEYLVDCDSTEMLKKRLSFLYIESELIKQEINSLRLARNSNVHKGRRPDNIGIKNFRLCNFIEDYFDFFISNPFKYQSLSRVLEFISLTTDYNTIELQIKNLQAVKKLIKKGRVGKSSSNL